MSVVGSSSAKNVISFTEFTSAYFTEAHASEMFVIDVILVSSISKSTNTGVWDVT